MVSVINLAHNAFEKRPGQWRFLQLLVTCGSEKLLHNCHLTDFGKKKEKTEKNAAMFPLTEPLHLKTTVFSPVNRDLHSY